jgi:hypothetical protein
VARRTIARKAIAAENAQFALGSYAMKPASVLVPMVTLVVLLAVASVHAVVAWYYADDARSSFGFLHGLAFSYAIAWGVELDRRGRNVGSVYEYSAFMFFFWPFMLPVYLFKTRRWRGLFVGLAVLASTLLPALIANLVVSTLWER